MQHSIRTVSLSPGPQELGRGARPVQDRASGRRDRLSVPSRHGLAAEEAAESFAEGDTGRQAARGRRARRDEVDSLFSADAPPPLEAPPGVTELTGWELAASMWREHLPEQLLGVDCSCCKEEWPCDAWNLANDLLTECCEAADREVQHSGLDSRTESRPES
jgi:hypothetical protein